MKISTREMLEFASTHRDRFVLCGSFGRAAVLGDNLSEMSHHPTSFKDVDLVDTQGKLQCKYSLQEGGILDFFMSASMRPTNGNERWGLFDELSNDPVPLVTFPERLLELETIQSGDFTFTIPSARAQLSLASFKDHTHAYRKHPEQKARLSETVQPSPKFAEVLDVYDTAMQERIAAASPYVRIRRQLFRSLPGVAEAISNSSFGEMLRKQRGTLPIPFDHETLRDQTPRLS